LDVWQTGAVACKRASLWNFLDFWQTGAMACMKASL